MASSPSSSPGSGAAPPHTGLHSPTCSPGPGPHLELSPEPRTCPAGTTAFGPGTPLPGPAPHGARHWAQGPLRPSHRPLGSLMGLLTWRGTLACGRAETPEVPDRRHGLSLGNTGPWPEQLHEKGRWALPSAGTQPLQASPVALPVKEGPQASVCAPPTHTHITAEPGKSWRHKEKVSALYRTDWPVGSAGGWGLSALWATRGSLLSSRSWIRGGGWAAQGPQLGSHQPWHTQPAGRKWLPLTRPQLSTQLLPTTLVALPIPTHLLLDMALPESPSPNAFPRKVKACPSSGWDRGLVLPLAELSP